MNDRSRAIIARHAQTVGSTSCGNAISVAEANFVLSPEDSPQTGALKLFGLPIIQSMELANCCGGMWPCPPLQRCDCGRMYGTPVADAAFDQPATSIDHRDHSNPREYGTLRCRRSHGRLECAAGTQHLSAKIPIVTSRTYTSRK